MSYNVIVTVVHVRSSFGSPNICSNTGYRVFCVCVFVCVHAMYECARTRVVHVCLPSKRETHIKGLSSVLHLIIFYSFIMLFSLKCKTGYKSVRMILCLLLVRS